MAGQESQESQETQEAREMVADFVESALLGTERRRGIWTDRDYLIAALALLSDGDRARKAGLAKPAALTDGNKPPCFADEPWWRQYEESAQELYDEGQYLVADDIRTLVDGLRDLEKKEDALAARLAEAEEALRATRRRLWWFIEQDAGNGNEIAAAEVCAEAMDIQHNVIEPALSASRNEQAELHTEQDNSPALGSSRKEQTK